MDSLFSKLLPFAFASILLSLVTLVVFVLGIIFMIKGIKAFNIYISKNS